MFSSKITFWLLVSNFPGIWCRTFRIALDYRFRTFGIALGDRFRMFGIALGDIFRMFGIA